MLRNDPGYYFYWVEYLLDNPVYNALTSGDAWLNRGGEHVKFFDEAVSPFVGFHSNHTTGFDELYEFLPAARRILYATVTTTKEPRGWQLVAEIKGLQFMFDNLQYQEQSSFATVPLTSNHVNEMVQLASLTKPGPFNNQTIAFGNYHGIFDHGKLVAMIGERLHVAEYTEISAVCTHPDHLGKGYASALLKHQLSLICRNAKIPFLHVRDDNARAIAVYERLGFRRRGVMNFYFMKRR